LQCQEIKQLFHILQTTATVTALWSRHWIVCFPPAPPCLLSPFFISVLLYRLPSNLLTSKYPILYDLELSQWLNSVKSSWAISCVRCLSFLSKFFVQDYVIWAMPTAMPPHCSNLCVFIL
jgi:hypothetical protein